MVQIHSPPTVQIDAPAALDRVGAAPEQLADSVYDSKQRNKNVSIHKVARVKWRQCSPALDQGQEDTSSETNPGKIRESHCLVRQLADASALDLPGAAESDVDDADAAPDEERADTREVHDVAVGPGSAGGHVHHRDGADGVGDEDGPDGDTSGVGPAKDLGGLARLRHIKDCA